jgi:hypothetical protein
VGIDANNDEIVFLNENNPNKEKIIFQQGSIDSEQQVKDLIKTHSADAIKSDIESNEWVFFNFSPEDFKNITSFAVEYHNHFYKQEFLNRYERWGFKLKAHGKLWIDGLGVLFFEK